MDPATLQARAGAWHSRRFPGAVPQNVALKALEELGEVAEALNATIARPDEHDHRGGSVVDEAADVVIPLLVLLARWFPTVDLIGQLDAKLERRAGAGNGERHDRAGTWHARQRPDAAPADVVFTVATLTGTLTRTLDRALQYPEMPDRDRHVGDAAADVTLGLLVLLERWYATDLFERVDAKLTLLADPTSGHRSAARRPAKASS